MFNSAPSILISVGCNFIDPCTLNICHMQSYVTCSCPSAFWMSIIMTVESKCPVVCWFLNFNGHLLRYNVLEALRINWINENFMLGFMLNSVQVHTLYFVGRGNKGGIYFFCKSIWKHLSDFIFISYNKLIFQVFYQVLLWKMFVWGFV